MEPPVIERLARMETKIDFLIEDREKATITDDNHEKRLVAIEGKQKLLATIGAALLFIVTFFQDWISTRLVG